MELLRTSMETGHATDRIVIFNNEDCFGAAYRLRHYNGDLDNGNRFFDARQINLECRTEKSRDHLQRQGVTTPSVAWCQRDYQQAASARGRRAAARIVDSPD
jgi:hypothetical protein